MIKYILEAERNKEDELNFNESGLGKNLLNEDFKIILKGELVRKIGSRHKKGRLVYNILTLSTEITYH